MCAIVENAIRKNAARLEGIMIPKQINEQHEKLHIIIINAWYTTYFNMFTTYHFRDVTMYRGNKSYDVGCTSNELFPLKTATKC